MKLRRPPRPSPALVIACLALFVALGGTVLAAAKIDGRTIRVKSLPGNRLAVGSLPGNRLAPHSVKAKQIDVDSLGPVPDAAHADSADSARRAQTAIAAEHAADATTINGRAVGCRGARREFAGACWDLQPSDAAVTATEAAAACGAAGGELPDPLSLLAFVQQPGVPQVVAGEWTKAVRVETSEFWDVTIVEGGTILRNVKAQLAYHYRCVTPLVG